MPLQSRVLNAIKNNLRSVILIRSICIKSHFGTNLNGKSTGLSVLHKEIVITRIFIVISVEIFIALINYYLQLVNYLVTIKQQIWKTN